MTVSWLLVSFLSVLPLRCSPLRRCSDHWWLLPEPRSPSSWTKPACSVIPSQYGLDLAAFSATDLHIPVRSFPAFHNCGFRSWKSCAVSYFCKWLVRASVSLNEDHSNSHLKCKDPCKRAQSAWSESDQFLIRHRSKTNVGCVTKRKERVSKDRIFEQVITGKRFNKEITAHTWWISK